MLPLGLTKLQRTHGMEDIPIFMQREFHFVEKANGIRYLTQSTDRHPDTSLKVIIACISAVIQADNAV